MGSRHGPGFGPEHMNNFNNLNFLWISIIGVLLLVIFILVVKLIQKNKLLSTNNETTNKALNILNERYAKGELTNEEFEHKKEVLNKKTIDS